MGCERRNLPDGYTAQWYPLPRSAGTSVEAGLVDTTAIHTSDLGFEICQWWACYQTPTGCGCPGLYCKGRFIWGYRIKLK